MVGSLDVGLAAGQLLHDYLMTVRRGKRLLSKAVSQHWVPPVKAYSSKRLAASMAASGLNLLQSGQA